MTYEIMLKYSMKGPMGIVIPFENALKMKAEIEGISYEDEIKKFNEFKDKQNNIKDVDFEFTKYEEVE